MAPRLSRKAGVVSGQTGQATPDVLPTPAAQAEPVKVSLYDSPAIKAALDDGARQVVIEAGYEEDHFVSTSKIVLGIAAIACALLAQFGPGKFPANWWMVFYCVAAYSVFTVLIYLHALFIEAGAILVCKSRRGTKQGLRMSSKMDRFDDQYTLTLYIGDKGSPGHRSVSTTASVEKYFHGNGYLCETALQPVVEQLLQEFEAKKNS